MPVEAPALAPVEVPTPVEAPALAPVEVPAPIDGQPSQLNTVNINTITQAPTNVQASLELPVPEQNIMNTNTKTQEAINAPESKLNTNSVAQTIDNSPVTQPNSVNANSVAEAQTEQNAKPSENDETPLFPFSSFSSRIDENKEKDVIIPNDVKPKNGIKTNEETTTQVGGTKNVISTLRNELRNYFSE
jgi:hypothetical protein